MPLCRCCTSEEEVVECRWTGIEESDGFVGLWQGLPCSDELILEEEGPVDTFMFYLERRKPFVPLGAMLDTSGSEVIRISTLKLGNSMIRHANCKAPANWRLQPGDFIMEVNSISGNTSEMLHEVLYESEVELRLCRPLWFTIAINMQNGPLGCVITYDATNGSSLVITAVNEGTVRTWNQANPKRAVQADDYIIAVDDRMGRSVELLAHIEQATATIELLVARPLCSWPPRQDLPA